MQKQFKRERIVIQQMALVQLNIHRQTNKLTFTFYLKINSKWITELNVKRYAVRLFRKKQEKNFGLRLGKKDLRSDTKIIIK